MEVLLVFGPVLHKLCCHPTIDTEKPRPDESSNDNLQSGLYSVSNHSVNGFTEKVLKMNHCMMSCDCLLNTWNAIWSTFGSTRMLASEHVLWSFLSNSQNKWGIWFYQGSSNYFVQAIDSMVLNTSKSYHYTQWIYIAAYKAMKYFLYYFAPFDPRGRLI